MHDQLLVKFFYAQCDLSDELADFLLRHPHNLFVEYVVPQSLIRVSTDEVNFVILFKVVDKLDSKLALVDALENFERVDCQFCEGIICGRASHLLHIKLFFRASMNGDPSCVYLVVGQVFFENVLTDTLLETLRVQQVVDTLEHQFMAQKVKFSVSGNSR